MLTLSNFFSWLSGPWMPENAGGFADNVDFLNGFILAVSYFFVAVIAFLMIYFSIKYRQTDRADVSHGAHHSTAIEIAWTLPIVAIVTFVFVVGFTGFLDMAGPPTGGEANAFHIRVEARKWGWTFYYPNGGSSDKLYVPADRPVELTLESNDVIHSLFVPAMRIKKDVVPGRYNRMWFQPDPNLVSAENPRKELDVNCTEYCGQGHSQMNTLCIVVHESQWDDVLSEINKFNKDGLSPAEYGEQVYQVRGGCVQCHSIDGSSGTGPSWKGLYGSERPLAVTDGESTVTADDAYIYESIRYPNRKKAEGFGTASMTTYGTSQLSAGDVRAVIEYMKTLAGQDPLEAFPEDYDGKTDASEESE
ncbi:MAG: cytochrome c oxidase subunit II [Algisphaera sp.]